MDNYEIFMTPRAHFELEEAFVAILELSASLDIAENYVDSIKSAVDQLSTFPKRGRIRERGEFAGKGYREIYIKEYTVIYRINEQAHQIQIVAIKPSSIK